MSDTLDRLLAAPALTSLVELRQRLDENPVVDTVRWLPLTPGKVYVVLFCVVVQKGFGGMVLSAADFEELQRSYPGLTYVQRSGS